MIGLEKGGREIGSGSTSAIKNSGEVFERGFVRFYSKGEGEELCCEIHLGGFAVYGGKMVEDDGYGKEHASRFAVYVTVRFPRYLETSRGIMMSLFDIFDFDFVSFLDEVTGWEEWQVRLLIRSSSIYRLLQSQHSFIT